MKALILAGGRGKRLPNITNIKNKCLTEINDKNLLEYNLDLITELDISEIIIVVGYLAEEIINKYGIEYKSKRIKYAIQREQRGLVHAIETAKELLGKEDFILFLGDQILTKPKIKEMISHYKEKNLFTVCGAINESNKSKISKTYAIMANENKRIFRLIEKPKNPIGNIQGTGFCVFRNELLNYISQTPTNLIRGEKELVDWIQSAIDEGQAVEYYIVGDKYTNINTEDDYIYAKDILANN